MHNRMFAVSHDPQGKSLQNLNISYNIYIEHRQLHHIDDSKDRRTTRPVQFVYRTTNFMDQSPSSEYDSFSAIHQLPRISAIRKLIIVFRTSRHLSLS